jgi:hypothetical protein
MSPDDVSLGGNGKDAVVPGALAPQPGNVDAATALAMGAAGNLYVADTGNNPVLMYTPDP